MLEINQKKVSRGVCKLLFGDVKRNNGKTCSLGVSPLFAEVVMHWLDGVSNNQIKCADVPGKKLKWKSHIPTNALRFPLCLIILSWVCLIIASGGEGKFCVFTVYNKKSNMKCNDCTHILGSVPSKAFPRTSTHFWSRGRSSSLEQTLLIGKIHINLPIKKILAVNWF